MSSLSPASRPALGALALASALLLSACAGEDPAGNGAATATGAAPSAAASSAAAPATGTGDATEPAEDGAAPRTGAPTGAPATAEPADDPAAGTAPDGSGTGGGGAAGNGSDGAGTEDSGTSGAGTDGAGAEGSGAAAGRAAGGRTGAGSPLCSTSQLEASAAPVGGAAGSVHVDLVLTNAGGEPCTIAGYAGVSFVDAAGTMIGSPAVRDATVPGTGRVVAPGESVSAGLRVSQAANHPACDARTAAGLRVYPPENTESVVIPFPAQACGDPRVHQLEIQGFGA